MIDEKIIVTEEIKELILGARKVRKITARDLSVQMRRSSYWLSNIENGRTKSIMKSELVEILKICRGMENGEAEQEIKRALTEFGYGKGSASEMFSSEEERGNLTLYGETASLEDISRQREEFDRYIGKIVSGYRYFFNHVNDKKEAVRVVENICHNMDVDLGFMISVEALPWYRLSSFTIEGRKELFDQVKAVLNSTRSFFDGQQDEKHES